MIFKFQRKWKLSAFKNGSVDSSVSNLQDDIKSRTKMVYSEYVHNDYIIEHPQEIKKLMIFCKRRLIILSRP